MQRRMLAGPRLVALALLLALTSPALGAAEEADSSFLRDRAGELEKQGDWLDARNCYDELLRKDKNDADAKDGYLRCQRHLLQIRRHSDPAFRQVLAHLKSRPDEALTLYRQVLGVIRDTFVDRSRVEVASLFRSGLQEFKAALEKNEFLTDHLANRKAETLEAFKARLRHWDDHKATTIEDACRQVQAIAGAARQSRLVSRADTDAFGVLVAVEFACGACNALDEFTVFLTPGHFQALQTALRGKGVGIGIEVSVAGQKVEVTRVHAKGPAANLLVRGDRILQIDRQPVDGMPVELIQDKLRGEAGSPVEIEVDSPAGMMVGPRVVKVTRQAFAMPSVVHEVLEEGDRYVGYVRVSGFQDSTLQEVKEALAQLQTVGVKGLILDLRGNPGGLLTSGVKVTELFVGEGVVAHGQSQVEKFNGAFRTSGANPFALPMVVLVDGETASVAELLAAALKELGRAKIVGQTTYGKGSIQIFVPFKEVSLDKDKLPGGIRLTVAKFFSPSKQAINGQGVEPHLQVEGDAETLLRAARQMLRELLGDGKMSSM